MQPYAIPSYFGPHDAAHLDLGDFPCTDGDLQLTGASQATVHLNGTLNTRMSGAAQLRYRGHPVLSDVSTTDAARIQPADGENQMAPSTQQARRFRATLTRRVALDYLLFLPSRYEADRSLRWPLMLFLHGAGERGRDLQQVRRHGPPKLVARRRAFPFVVASPQCPRDEWWHAQDLSALLDDLVARHRIDVDRIYLTGLSMGGFGTWGLAGAEPDRFAAIAPICGGGDWRQARAIADSRLPVWAFHGGSDTVVPPAESRRMVQQVKARGGDARLTVYPGVGHDSWTRTYADRTHTQGGLYDWMLAHTRRR